MLSIPEIAVKLVDQLLTKEEDDKARTLFLVGSKNAGKSTLLNAFLEKPDAPRETLVLEYSFGRKSNQKQGLEKTICHIWEYGGKLDALKNVLPSIPITGKFYFCIMLDFSKIKRIWDTIENCIEAMQDCYSDQEKMPELIIIGGKYDIFKNYDSEIKKFICTTIRSVAVLYNAHVIFYSSKEAPLARRTKDLLHIAGFGNGIVFKEKNTNFAKPLAIPRGSDSWENIGTSSITFEQLKIKHLSRIPPEVIAETNVTHNPQASHPEPVLDKLAALKFQELRNLDSLDISIDDYLTGLNK